MYEVGSLYTGEYEGVVYTDVPIYAVARYADGSRGLLLSADRTFVLVRIPATA